MSYGLLAVFFSIDLLYFSANLLKVPDGGWFPLLIGAIAFTLLTTWARGRQLMIARMNEASLPIEIFIKSAATSAVRVAGTAVFMTSSASGVPHALLHNLKHNKVLHERIILLTVRIEDVPFIRGKQRLEISDYGSGFFRVVLRYGFMEEVDVPDGADRAQGLRAAMQNDGDQLLPRPPDPPRERQAGDGDLARKIVRLDVAQCGKRDGILQAADQPRGRAWKPGGNLARFDIRRATCALPPHWRGMDQIASWVATVATILAACMTASNLGWRITGTGFIVFTVGSIAWLAVGLLTGQPALVWTNIAMTGFNLFGVWRWLGRQASVEHGAERAAATSERLPGDTLFPASLLTRAKLVGQGGEALGTLVDAMVG